MTGPVTAPPLAGRVRARLEALGVAADTPLVVAVSGGADSVVLLHLLRFAVGGEPGRIVAAHFDHGMRAESASDAHWVRGLARGWQLRAEVGIATEPLHTETEARVARWRFLDAVRAEVGAEWVVTAHHRDDQAETVLHHLLRGAGLRGLAGMRPQAGRRLRPLLDEPRSELRHWAARSGLRWRIDATNALPLGPRNRLRHEGLPLLEQIRPGASRALARAAEIVAGEEAALSAAESLLLERWIHTRRPGRIVAELGPLRALAPPLLTRLLRRMARDVGAPLDAAGTRAALQFILAGPGGGETRIPPGVTLRRSLDWLEVERTAPGTPPEDREVRVARPLEGGEAVAVIGGERWAVQWGREVSEAEWTTALPAPPHAGGFHIRGWREGDRLDGRSVSRLWSRAGVPRHQRRRRPVVDNGRGRLLWVPGSARSARLDEQSGPLYRIGISHVESG